MDRQYDGKYVGKIITYPSECYDKRTDRIVIKNRPGLAISQTQSGTYIVLPLSTKEPRNTEEMKFDLKVDPDDYPELHLRKTSWIKPGMQTYVYEPTVTHEISDMARTNPELYRKALMTHLEWNHQVNMNAVSHALKIRVEQTNAKTAVKEFQQGRDPQQAESLGKTGSTRTPEPSPAIHQPESVRTAERTETVRAPAKEPDTKEARKEQRKEQGKRHYLKACRKPHGRERGGRSR